MTRNTCPALINKTTATRYHRNRFHYHGFFFYLLSLTSFDTVLVNSLDFATSRQVHRQLINPFNLNAINPVDYKRHVCARSSSRLICTAAWKRITKAGWWMIAATATDSKRVDISLGFTCRWQWLRDVYKRTKGGNKRPRWNIGEWFHSGIPRRAREIPRCPSGIIEYHFLLCSYPSLFLSTNATNYLSLCLSASLSSTTYVPLVFFLSLSTSPFSLPHPPLFCIIYVYTTQCINVDTNRRVWEPR